MPYGIVIDTFEESFKIIDFSTARYAEVDSIFYDCAGTSGYRAPEVQFSLNDGYSPFPLDIWSFGVCLYTFMHEKVLSQQIISYHFMGNVNWR